MKNRMVKMAAATAVAGAIVLGGGSAAFAHEASVSTPSGQENCQFMGGPGNPGHEGHSHGHTKAQAHEQSDTFEVGNC